MSTEFEGIGMTSRRTRERLARRLRSEGVDDERVLEAIRAVPRHIFVDEALASRAYEDVALPIGNGQTISQPYIVARMTELLLGGSTPRRVLEVGTGCGYQTAVLARVVDRVYSIERIATLLEGARARLRALGLHKVRLRHGDGFEGWPEQAPFDGILVTAAPSAVPAGLLEQLAPGASLVIPVGEHGYQRLMSITRGEEGFEEREFERVSFVPMLGGRG